MPNYISAGKWFELTTSEVTTLGTNPTVATIESVKTTVIATGRRSKEN